MRLQFFIKVHHNALVEFGKKRQLTVGKINLVPTQAKRRLPTGTRESQQLDVILAPQRQQVVVMERDGFPSPATVTSFLLKRELVEGAVVVVDEAGQIGGRQMVELLRLARERKGGIYFCNALTAPRSLSNAATGLVSRVSRCTATVTLGRNEPRRRVILNGLPK
jgi:hypothetical protein